MSTTFSSHIGHHPQVIQLMSSHFNKYVLKLLEPSETPVENAINQQFYLTEEK